MTIYIRHLETPRELAAVEELQKKVWLGDDIEVVPAHLLQAAMHGGGVLIGAFDDNALVGFVFGFPGFEQTTEGKKLWHCSHMAGVHPDYRDAGLGFKLKRAQWQMVRQQGLDRITWTYDPLQSRNAKLNIAKLGAVCNTYCINYYGEMRDQLNVGLPTDRFQVDWWVNSSRVKRRLSKSPRKKLDLAHYLSAETARLNETELNDSGLITPRPSEISVDSATLLLLEIPADFLAIKTADPALALKWRMHTRTLFQDMFAAGYLVTDFIYLPGGQPRSYYVLSFGESTL
jgi:predicted GNAT superfamily acetyltransferase